MKRITITIPESLLQATDERAEALDRSRSWVVVDALRRCLAEARIEPEQGERTYDTEPPVTFVAAGLGPYRLAQLEADLALPLERRVREAELAARVTELRTTPLRSQRVLTFDRYEDYLEWERWEERAR